MNWTNFKLHLSISTTILLFVGIMSALGNAVAPNGSMMDNPLWLLIVTLTCIGFVKYMVAQWDK